MFALFLFTFKENIQFAKKVLRLAMEYADGDKCKIVYSSPEAMVEFSGEKKLKLGLNARQKPICKIYIERSRYFFIRHRQNSITSHAKLALCKECNQILLFFVYLLKGRRVQPRSQDGKMRDPGNEVEESHVSQTNRVFLKRGLQPHRGSCLKIV